MLVSIVIPIYNVSDYLDTCLRSVINQTYNEIEIIAVNDGSTDTSLQTIESYALKDARIIIVNKPNDGLASAREAGVKASTGAYITILDGDDSLPVDAISKYVKAIEQSHADIIIGAFIYQYPPPQFKKEIKEDLEYSGLMNNIEFLKLILGLKVSPGISCKIYSKHLFDNVEMPRFKMGQDIPLSVQLVSSADKIFFLNEPMYNYLIRNISSERNSNSEYVKDYYMAIKWTLEYTKQQNIESLKSDIELFELIMTIDVLQRNGFFIIKEKIAELKTSFHRRKSELKLWQRFIFSSFKMGNQMGSISSYIVIKTRMLYTYFTNFN